MAFSGAERTETRPYRVSRAKDTASISVHDARIGFISARPILWRGDVGCDEPARRIARERIPLQRDNQLILGALHTSDQ
eukprot:scaffold4058_cov257-Pinguiococcus_pyrenoidosus.AAC.15